MNVAVIGGGIFGAMAALELSRTGRRVTLFERLPELMRGASYNNQNRLHLGFHYPRDDETARQCQKGFARFVAEFEECILGGFPNAYFIGSKDSQTSPEAFLDFCRRHQLAIREVDLKTFVPAVQNVEIGVLTDELVYDSAMVRDVVTRRLKQSQVQINLDDEVIGLKHALGCGYDVLSKRSGEQTFDAVVNCCYANINRITAGLGHTVAVCQYEYTAVAVIELDFEQPIGITILDGRFMTLLPFGKTGKYLLYHVEHVIIARDDSRLLDLAWLNPETSPFSEIDKSAWFSKMLESCSEFVPALRGARLCGFLEGPRMVLANRDDTDTRPSIVISHEPGYITVFSGKIDHCTWVAEDIADRLNSLGR